MVEQMLDFEPIYLTLKLALVTTVILFLIGVPIAFWLAYNRSRFSVIIETIISMPLVLPPSVIGFYLLVAFSPENTFGSFLDRYFDLRLVFSFPGLVIASVIYSLPFMIHPIQSGFKSLPPNLIDAAMVMGKGKFTILNKVLLPNITASLLTALTLTFAHTIGEFGIVMMVGGSIPGETKVASIAIYDEVQAMNYSNANKYAAILFTITFIILLSVYIFSKRKNKTSPLQ